MSSRPIIINFLEVLGNGILCLKKENKDGFQITGMKEPKTTIAKTGQIYFWNVPQVITGK
jgi:hypothetical protein